MDGGSSGEGAFFKGDTEPESAIEEYGGHGNFSHFEQEQKVKAPTETQAVRSPQQKRARIPKTLLSLPNALLASIFQALDNHTDVYSLAATNSHMHDILTCYKLDILISATPKPLATLLAASSSSLSSSYTPSLSLSENSIYDSISSYFAAIRYHTAICQRIKSLIRTHCRFFLSKHLLTPSSPSDEIAFDGALHHLWAFSLIFNSSKRLSTSTDDVSAQSHWLRQLNLSMRQLKDILEVYQCIGVLLCPLTEDLRAAVQAGVIDVLPVRADMETALELWVMQLQTLELGKIVRVLEMADEKFSGEDRWSEVQSSGLAGITAGENRRMWLKCAVGEVYKELQDLERRSIVPRKGVWGQTISYMSDMN